MMVTGWITSHPTSWSIKQHPSKMIQRWFNALELPTLFLRKEWSTLHKSEREPYHFETGWTTRPIFDGCDSWFDAPCENSQIGVNHSKSFHALNGEINSLKGKFDWLRHRVGGRPPSYHHHWYPNAHYKPYWKETLIQMFWCQFYKTFKNNYFVDLLRFIET